MNNYSISKTSDKTFSETVDAVKTALLTEGFGVLTEIDVKAKMKEKIDKEMEEYLILGACHPPSAYRAIELEDEVGLFLPCNVIVYKSGQDVIVSAIRPTLAMSMIPNPDLGILAKEIEDKLERVLLQI